MIPVLIPLFLTIFFALQAFGDPVKVAIVDTGVNLEHSEFKPFLDKHPKDGLQAYDFIAKKRNTIDIQGHGTNIASIITLSNKNKFKIIPLRFTNGSDSADDLFRDMSNFNQAVNMAIELGVDVINISYTHIIPRFSEEELFKKAQAKGIIVVVAAGNTGTDLDTLDDNHKTYPCNYNLENIICVGNWDNTTGKRAESSNYGGRVKIYTDGNNVVGLGKNSTDPTETLNIMSGTSQAAAKISRWIIQQKINGKKYQEILKLVQSTPVIKEIP
jgi:subtilisin family serine protease